MLIAELPKFEEIRLADLHLYNILDTPAEKEFDELRELAAQICNCPVSMITLVDKDRQWFKSKQNIDETETERDTAFCAHAILDNKVMVVEDATKDIRFFDNPYVTAGMNIRFYAGAPIISPAGHNLGTICVIDKKPRVLTSEQERALIILSNQVTKLLELRLKSNLIEQRAKELIAINELSATELIKQKDAESLVVARELHENIAQDIATVALHLSMLNGADNKNAHLFEIARNTLNKAMATVKSLSYSFSPSTLESTNLQQLLDNLIETTGMPAVDVQLHVKGNTSAVSFEQSVSCTRITETWLKVLYKQTGLSFVKIDLEVTNDIHLVITDDAANRSFEEKEKELFFHSLYYRVVAMNGHVRFVESADGMNELHIQLPIVKNEAVIPV